MRLKSAHLLAAIAGVCAFSLSSCLSIQHTPQSQFPNVTIWAWDSPNDLRFLSSSKESVAAYAGTIYLSDATAYLKPNEKTIEVADEARIFPAFRIESRGKVSDLSVDKIEIDEQASGQIAAIVDIVAKHLASVKKSNVPAVQIDFDATTKERNFYRALLRQIRLKLGPDTRISVTALASWCLGDRWLSGEDVDEAVVMLFSMGAGQSEAMRHIKRGELFAGQDIELALGLSANERHTNTILLKDKKLFVGRHLYLFNSLPWTEKRLRLAEHELCVANQN